MPDVVPSNAELIAKLRAWDADWIARSAERVKSTAEVFTPTALVHEILGELSEAAFLDEAATFCDPSCGNGQFLSEVLIRKLENGHDFETALRTIFGIDIMIDNVDVCRDRLLCGVEQYRYIVENNIICADFLSFDMDGWSEAPPFDPKLASL